MAIERNEFISAVSSLGLEQSVAVGLFNTGGSSGGSSIDPARVEALEQKVLEVESVIASIPTGDNFGWFNYNNSIPSQVIPANQWTTLQNDTLGVETNTQFSPTDITRMLDAATGRVILNELKVGDEVFIRYTINIVPYTNNTTYYFSHYFGEGPAAYRLPLGVPTILDEGAGIPTGDFLVDTHFFIKDDAARISGMLPQVNVTSESVINYTGCYISVNRR